MRVVCFVLQGACSKSVIEDIVVSSYRRIDGLHTLEVLLFSVRHIYLRTCPNPVDMENSDLASVEFWDHFIMHVFIVQIWLASLWICWQITCRGSERSCSEVFLVPWFYLFKEIEFFHFGYARFLHLSIYVLKVCAIRLLLKSLQDQNTSHCMFRNLLMAVWWNSFWPCKPIMLGGVTDDGIMILSTLLAI